LKIMFLSTVDESRGTGAEPEDSELAPLLDRALEILKRRRGVDFSGYRRSTMERRLANRMMSVAVSSADAYLTLLESSDREPDHLMTNLVIKVSRFYRNAGTFDRLAALVPLLRERFGPAPLTAWSAGCAFGEEAYTLAALLGQNDVVDATDIDENALAFAEKARYTESALYEMPPSLRARLLNDVHDADGFVVRESVQARVRFFRHDLTRDLLAPRETYQLICCRNVLIYFTRPYQVAVQRLLRRSLAPGGILCLGEAEWPLEADPTLVPLDRKARIFEAVRSAP
jgi:chemotaxis methyl-accepting protein methylase